jgi:UDP-N-acetylmuramate: L-alanyl-gamma-D-glutamyl-meso-diaminopimelate ligase
MGNAALLAREAGHEVLGADTGVYPPMSTVLSGAGITLHEGYEPARLQTLAPDLVVVGNAMSRGNAEVEWLLDTRALPFVSLPALLHQTILSKRDNIVVCGTHGKTTTTALTAFLLRENGRDPGYLIGGVPQDPPTGNHLGSPADPFVIEGDEYDSAFFDKRSKFIHYAPRIAVMNNLEFDHADIFRDVVDIQRTFNHLARIVPRNGCIVVNGDDDNLKALGNFPWTRVVRVGLGEHNDVRLVDFQESPEGSSFQLFWKNKLWTDVRWQLPGLFNARNASMAATAAGLILQLTDTATRPNAQVTHYVTNGILSPGLAEPDPRRITLECLGRFRGVKRRQEIIAQVPQVSSSSLPASRFSLLVIEDFGHHPTALAETLGSLRNRYPGVLLTAVFEPRSNTARTRALQGAFMRALSLADEVYLGAVNRADKLKPEERFDPEAVCQQLDTQGVSGHWFATNAELLEKLQADTLAAASGGGPRLVVFFSNGSFDGITARYAAAAARP